ncbi:hypothetical protein POM88_014110 [Heracleum sosnowskyi]|uniref:BED-type domain-containing protein n=1 Tax=Heracleum sosnowskyi TaxID=360622 RepID=A0AAD8J1C9_9APIA|nr:hypothetical protein POM88_014110 [Heracleum sosnowskyi]
MTPYFQFQIWVMNLLKTKMKISTRSICLKRENKLTDGSRIEIVGSASEAATQNNQSEDKLYQRKRRGPTSEVWQYLDRLEVDGKDYVRCKFCATTLNVSDNKSTSSFNRHVEKCLAKQGQNR